MANRGGWNWSMNTLPPVDVAEKAPIFSKGGEVMNLLVPSLSLGLVCGNYSSKKEKGHQNRAASPLEPRSSPFGASIRGPISP